MTLEEKVKKALEDISYGVDFSVKKFTPTARLIGDLGLDSLDHVEFIMKIEDEFHTEVPDDVGDTWKTVGDVITYLKSKGFK